MHDCIHILKMNKDLIFEFEIPEGVTAEVTEGRLTLKKADEAIIKKIDPRIDIKLENNNVIISSKKNSKNERKIFGTLKAHINNMIKGLTEKFKYKLMAVNVHFPMNVSVDKEKNMVVIKNFLGEKKDRTVKIIEGTDINVNKNEIIVESSDIEKAGQMAANLEKGTKVKNRDRRIFQDGIFIIEKPGRVFFNE